MGKAREVDRLLGWPRLPGDQPAPGRASARLHGAGSRVKRRLRSTVAFARCRPDFIVIGEQKCGTSALYAYLMQHPAVLGYWNKEVHYFDLNYERGPSWYLAHFPLAVRRRAVRRAGAEPVVGEATAAYFFPPEVPARVHAYDASLRLILLLRNPVERAYSDYRRRRRLRAQVTFAEAIEQELAGASRLDLLARGRYADQLERWYSFFPPEQVLVLRTEDLGDDPLAALHTAERFLGVTPSGPRVFPPVNANPGEPLDPELGRLLTDHFRPSNERLAALLGRDLWPAS